LLSDAERTRAARYRFAEDRQRYMAGRASLRRILARQTGLGPKELVVLDAENQKPRLALSVGEAPVYFNVSHSGDYALIATCSSAEIGIDIEQIRLDCPVDDLSRRYYSAREHAWLRRLNTGERINAFYRLWTIKEAVLKCLGVGLSLEPASVQVVFSGDAPPTLTCFDAAHTQVERFVVRELASIAGYALALAADAPSIDIIDELTSTL
jgi:4'-phosphopantetheinyl transferase